MLLLVVLLEIYLRELRTENVYEAIKLPLFRKEGVGGRFNYSNLSKIPLILFYKRGGLFYDVAFSDFIRNIFERVKNGERLWAIKLPLFCKEGLGRFKKINKKANLSIRLLRFISNQRLEEYTHTYTDSSVFFFTCVRIVFIFFSCCVFTFYE